jgi:hypothetical protein
MRRAAAPALLPWSRRRDEVGTTGDDDEEDDEDDDDDDDEDAEEEKGEGEDENEPGILILGCEMLDMWMAEVATRMCSRKGCETARGMRVRKGLVEGVSWATRSLHTRSATGEG